MENNKAVGKKIDAACAIEKFELYLKAREKTIQSGSYDCILFLTRYVIRKIIINFKWNKTGLFYNSNELIRMYDTVGKNEKRYLSIKGKLELAEFWILKNYNL